MFFRIKCQLALVTCTHTVVALRFVTLSLLIRLRFFKQVLFKSCYLYITYCALEVRQNLSLILRNPRSLHLSFGRYLSLDSLWHEDVDDHIELRSPRTLHLRLIKSTYHHYQFSLNPSQLLLMLSLLNLQHAYRGKLRSSNGSQPNLLLETIVLLRGLTWKPNMREIFQSHDVSHC